MFPCTYADLSIPKTERSEKKGRTEKNVNVGKIVYSYLILDC